MVAIAFSIGLLFLLIDICDCFSVEFFCTMQQLYDEFVAHIGELRNLDARIQRKVEKLESSLEKEARAHTEKVTDLQKSNQVAFTHFQVRCKLKAWFWCFGVVVLQCRSVIYFLSGFGIGEDVRENKNLYP